MSETLTPPLLVEYVTLTEREKVKPMFKKLKEARNWARNNRKKEHVAFTVTDYHGNFKNYVFK